MNQNIAPTQDRHPVSAGLKRMAGKALVGAALVGAAAGGVEVAAQSAERTQQVQAGFDHQALPAERAAQLGGQVTVTQPEANAGQPAEAYVPPLEVPPRQEP